VEGLIEAERQDRHDVGYCDGVIVWGYGGWASPFRVYNSALKLVLHVCVMSGLLRLARGKYPVSRAAQRSDFYNIRLNCIEI
jgi:hypothetical protein